VHHLPFPYSLVLQNWVGTQLIQEKDLLCWFGLQHTFAILYRVVLQIPVMSLYHYPLVGLPSSIKPLSFNHRLVSSPCFFIFCYSYNLSLLLPSSLISFCNYSLIFLSVCHHWFVVFTFLKTCLSLSLFFTPLVVLILLKCLNITSTTPTTPITQGVYLPC